MNYKSSVFTAECLCGCSFEAQSREYVGPSSGGILFLDWRAASTETTVVTAKVTIPVEEGNGS
jgi:hypothetical protein